MLSEKLDKPRCNCGIFGIFGHPEAAVMTYYGLHALQHRGQEASGIVATDISDKRTHSKFKVIKGTGLVSDIFVDDESLKESLSGNAAIGHNRYSTTGATKNKLNIQPFTVNYKSGNLALAHNGNLTNFHSLREKLENEGTIFQSTSDSEIILHLAARSKEKEQIAQIKEALETIEGAFSIVILTDTSLIAACDSHGFRPLSIGKIGSAYVVASETCAFDIIDATYLRDVEPGEMLVINDDGTKSEKLKSTIDKARPADHHHCIFEYVYFSRPDSHVFGHSVDKVRRKLGKLLAQESPVTSNEEGDTIIVISVPDSSNTATLGFATESSKTQKNLRMEIGLIRSHYVGRIFIQPDQHDRELKVKTKFNTVKGVLENRIVVIVDDSIVRGTTSSKLVKLIREANPKEIHFRVSSPPIKYPCFYGMDFPRRAELIANRLENNIQAIADELGVDSLSYLSIDKLLEAVPHDKSQYCTACFSGQYPVPIDIEVSKDAHD